MFLTLLLGGMTLSAVGGPYLVAELAETTVASGTKVTSMVAELAEATAKVTSTGSVTTDEARLLRFPATNGTEVVFSYAGDLFTAPLSGGEARRLTSHIGYEMFARYSPDGKTIAFTGEYDGNREVTSSRRKAASLSA